MNKLVEKQINKIFQEVWKKIFTQARLEAALRGNKQNVKLAVKRLKESKQYQQFCQEFAKKLAQQGLNKQKGIWRKYFEAAKKNHMGVIEKTLSDFERKMLEKTVRQNFKMIKSIPEEVFKTYKEKGVQKLVKEVAEGNASRGSFQTFLVQRRAKKAQVIARTETAKLQTFITETRAKDLGSNAYVWNSTKDVRTRASHKAMNGVVVLWRKNENEKPLLDEMYGHAGEFPNCRCDPAPIFDSGDLPSGSRVKFYNYKTHKIETISRSLALYYIEEGEIKAKKNQ